MDSSAPQRRIKAIHSHLLPHAIDRQQQQLLHPNATAGELVLGKGYSVVLPEKLQTGNWNVYRSALSPLMLVSRFPNHPNIGTLHDNFV